MAGQPLSTIACAPPSFSHRIASRPKLLPVAQTFMQEAPRMSSTWYMSRRWLGAFLCLAIVASASSITSSRSKRSAIILGRIVCGPAYLPGPVSDWPECPPAIRTWFGAYYDIVNGTRDSVTDWHFGREVIVIAPANDLDGLGLAHLSRSSEAVVVTSVHLSPRGLLEDACGRYLLPLLLGRFKSSSHSKWDRVLCSRI